MARPLLAALALTASGAVCAGDPPPFSYAYLSASYDHHQERTSGLPSDGFSLGLSLDATEHTFFSIGYSSSRTDEFLRDDGASGQVETRVMSGGFGAHAPVSSRVDLTWSADALRVRAIGQDGFAGDPVDRRDGFATDLGLRWLALSWLEVRGGRGYSHVGDEQGWSSSAGLSLNFSPRLGIDAGYFRGGELDGWSAGLRTLFGGDPQ